MYRVVSILFALVVVLSVGAWFSFHKTTSPTLMPLDIPMSEVRTAFTKAIEREGPQKAYKHIVTKYASANVDAQHALAHIIGETLYVTHGIEGIQYCDPTFAFGCYHGFFTEAVTNEGLTIVGQLDVACSAVPRGEPSACRHGIGHGILEYLGTDNLSEALTVCLETTQPNPVAGCTSGVFMEYNVPLIDDGAGTFSTQARPLGGDPYDPCPSVPEEFQESCYHELPQWWEQVYEHDHAAIGALCAGLNEQYSFSCFVGYGGVVAPSAGYDPALARAHCDEIADERGAYLCKAGAAWSIMGDGGGIDDALKVCNKTRPEFFYTCPSAE